MNVITDTDQTVCYDSAGREQACEASGQDAAHPKRFLRDQPRFERRGDIVIDSATGLAWTARADLADFPVAWDDAAREAAGMAARSAHGLSGWRLPKRRELFSLISHQHTKPALPPGHPFSRVFAGAFWTADAVSRLPEQAWQVHVGDGRLIKANAHGPQSNEALFWPVCSIAGADGKDNTAEDGGMRFENVNGLVHDSVTGLFWTPDPASLGGLASWSNALHKVADLNRQGFLGHFDWRLPNIRELESLTELSAHSPALPPGHPFGDVGEGYWSSTTSVYEPRYAWAWYARDGFVGVGFKSDPAFFVWPVRG